MRIAATLLALLLAGSGCRSVETQRPGVLDFPATGSPEAHDHFIDGVISLHNSAYDDAADHFVRAQQVDPDFVMAYWGEAMSYNRTFWGQYDVESARRALAKLGPTSEARLARAKTPREREYLQAVEILYGEGDQNSRDFRFAEAMGEIVQNHPEDYEAVAFHALALIQTLRAGDHTHSIQDRTAAMLERVLDKYPEHPGGLHYLIHSYDDPAYAQNGLEAARLYERIADQNFHALHMTGHIYLQLGMWTDTVRANEKAFAASERHMQDRGLSLAGRDYHSLEWLMYGLIQLGRYREARECVDTMLESAIQAGVPGMTGQAAVFAARFAVETGQWDVLDPYPENTRTADLLFAQGMAALKQNELSRVPAFAAALSAVTQQHAAAGRTLNAGIAESLGNELRAALALAENHEAEAERLAAESVKYEATMEYPSGPPDVVKPAYEFYGEVLLAVNKPAQAAEQFRISLERTPKRALSLLGLARALNRMDDASGAADAYRQLAEIWINADPSIPALAEVRAANP